MEVRLLGDGDTVWEQINTGFGFSIFHTRAWKNLVQEVFGHRPHYLAAIRNDVPVDVLPAFVVSRPFSGKRLVSTPYEGCNGGFVSDDPQAHAEIVKQLLRNAENLGVKNVEIRRQSKNIDLEHFGFKEYQPLLISELGLADEQANWNLLTTKHRRNVRTARKKGVTVEFAATIKEMRTFYGIVSDHYHGMGLPYPGWRYFKAIWEHLICGGLATLQLAVVDGNIVGGHLLFLSGDNLISKYSACTRGKRPRKIYGSYALFWEAIRYGIENGFNNFNMGITGSSNQGLLDFKNRFGAQTEPLYFDYYQFRGNPPDFSKYYGGFRLVKKVWRLTPSIFTAPLGHVINKWYC